MSDNNWQFDIGRDVPHDVSGMSYDIAADIRESVELLPDGRDALVLGEVERFADINTKQGDNPYGFQGTCGVVSCKNVLREFGIEVEETDVLRYAIEHDLCYHGNGAADVDPGRLGGTTEFGQAQLLSELGVPSHTEVDFTVDELASRIGDGHAAIIEVNAGVLWDRMDAYDHGQANHAITVTGVARDVNSGDVMGVYVNDSAPPSSGRFISRELLEDAWVETGGSAVVTDISYV